MRNIREPHEVEPEPMTELELLRHGIAEIAHLAPGGHLTDPCYGARVEIKNFALRILNAAEATRKVE